MNGRPKLFVRPSATASPPRGILRRIFLLLLAASATAVHASSDFASERLLTIAAREEKIYKQIAEDPEFYTAEDLDRRIGELLEAYQAYLTDNEDDVSALVLYGKLLRRVGERDRAFDTFLRADELDPQIAVVKQQIGTYLAEEGKGKAALPFYLAAVDLEPDTAIYHFGLGTLLVGFREDLTEDELFTDDAIDREMLKAFRKAAALEPENEDFKMRLGEAYYDLANPDWKSALLHWNRVRKETTDILRIEIIDLHRARVLGKLGRRDEARKLAESITQPGLQYSKETVLAELSSF